MRLKRLIGDVLVVTIVGAVALGLYKYLQLPGESEKSARYSNAHEGVEFESADNTRANLEDCERFLDRTMVESCRQAKLKKISAQD